MKRILAYALSLILFLLTTCHAAVAVRMDGDAALLTDEGNEIIPSGNYTDIAPLGDGYFAALGDSGYLLMNEDGELLSTTCYETLKRVNGVLLAEQDGLWSILSEEGTPLGEFAYTKVVIDVSGNGWALTGNPNDSRSDCLLRLSSDGSMQETQSDVTWMDDEASNGLLAIQLSGSGLCGYCDIKGKMVIHAQYDSASAFKNGLAVVTKGGKCGVINTSGKVIVETEYDFADIAASGVIVLMRDDTALALRSDGSEIARFEGDNLSIGILGDGFALDDGESCRAFDAEGNELVSTSSRAAFIEGIDGQIIISDGAWGEECVYILGADKKYQNLYPLCQAGTRSLYVYMKANTARYTNDILNETQLSTDMESARYGVVDDKGEVLLEANYLSIRYLGDDRLLLQSETAWQMADTDGNIYWEQQK